MAETLKETVKNNWFPVLLGFGAALAGLHITDTVPFDVQWEYAENFGERGIDAFKYWFDIGKYPHEEDRLEGLSMQDSDKVEMELTLDRVLDLGYLTAEKAQELFKRWGIEDIISIEVGE